MTLANLKLHHHSYSVAALFLRVHSQAFDVTQWLIGFSLKKSLGASHIAVHHCGLLTVVMMSCFVHLTSGRGLSLVSSVIEADFLTKFGEAQAAEQVRTHRKRVWLLFVRHTKQTSTGLHCT